MANEQQLNAAISFLATYAGNYGKRKEIILSLEERCGKLKAAVEEYRKTKEQIDVLRAQNKSEEKFLINMKNMIEHNEIGIGEGPLFNQKPEETHANQQ